MPLVRNDEHFQFERFVGVYFYMRDADAHMLCQVDVLCQVSHEALRDRSAHDRDGASLPDTFVRHRQRIEAIASRKFDQGHRRNDLIQVFSRDLVAEAK
jgi:hypothetical protein